MVKVMSLIDEDYDAKLIFSLKKAVSSIDVPPMCIALVDAQAELYLFHRMKNSPERCIQIAIAKAYSAVRLGGSTQNFQIRLKRDGLSLLDFCDSKLTSLPGGDVVRENSGLIKFGVAVSGGSMDDDLRALENILNIFR